MLDINKIIKETVNPPKSEDEKRFMDKHIVAKHKHPVAKDDQFTAKTKKDKTKIAGHHGDEDKAVYEAADVHTKRADKKAVIVRNVDPITGQSKTITRQSRAGEIKVEEVEQIDENFSAGNLKLRDGSTVKLNSKEAMALNSLFLSLNDKNQEKMDTKMMKNKKGFEEILAFAKEAM